MKGSASLLELGDQFLRILEELNRIGVATPSSRLECRLDCGFPFVGMPVNLSVRTNMATVADEEPSTAVVVSKAERGVGVQRLLGTFPQNALEHDELLGILLDFVESLQIFIVYHDGLLGIERLVFSEAYVHDSIAALIPFHFLVDASLGLFERG